MLHRFFITLVASAALGSVLIGTGASVEARDRHHRGHHVGYAGPLPSRSWTGISTHTGGTAQILRGTYPTWPEGSPNYHGSNGG